MDRACNGKLTRTFTVTQEKLATSVGSGSVEVLATPMVAAMMENTAAALAQQELDGAGETDCTTVGTSLSMTHDAPSPLGALITVTAVLEKREGRKFSFSLEASDNAGVISKGTHERVSVKKATFAEKAAARLAGNR